MNTERPTSYRDGAAGQEQREAAFDFEGLLWVLLALGLALLPFVQLAVTGDASQTDMGVSVLILFLLVTSVGQRVGAPSVRPR